MARLLAEETLEEKVGALAGERHSSERPSGKHLCRWGSNTDSIRIDEGKVPIDVPRAWDTDAGEEQTLKSYRAIKATT